ncbi:carbohydrate porin [Vibrio chagasii]|nr:carbohydrate porin [Vibrio chagasii]
MEAYLNVRLAQEFTENFEMVYEGSLQYMDFGQRDRASERRFLQSDSCTNTRKSFQPVLAFDRPELRFAVSYVDWSEDLNGYSISTDANAATMERGGEGSICTADGNLVLIA